MHFIETKSILNKNSMNIYRGCTHGCIYCDSRSSCYRIDHDFEDIAVKANALELLDTALGRRRKKSVIGTGSMSDAYVHAEQRLGMTRSALEIIYRHGFGATVLTKSEMVLRDIDILEKIQHRARAVVQMTLTTFDEDLCRILEPRVSTTARRVEALQTLAGTGIDTVVWLGPVLPYINDNIENIRGIIDYCIEARVKAIVCFGMGLTLRDGNREYFYEKLDEHFPGLKKTYMQEFGNAYMINSPKSTALMNYIHRRCSDAGILIGQEDVFAYVSHLPARTDQPDLF
jgi:DNA repair photolyase